MNQHEKINYLELPSKNIEANKRFFTAVFAWSFTDYGPEYAAFTQQDAGMDGGFYQSGLNVSTENGSALVVFYSENLAQTQSKIEKEGGKIIKSIFAFPGGHRFHFSDPSDNEYAVWSDQ